MDVLWRNCSIHSRMYERGKEVVRECVSPSPVRMCVCVSMWVCIFVGLSWCGSRTDRRHAEGRQSQVHVDRNRT